MTFSEKLKILRKEKKLNQEDASKEIDIALSTLRKYEQVGNPDVPQLKKIKEFYNVSYDYLLNDNCNTRNVDNLEIVKELGITEKTINSIRETKNKEFLEDLFTSYNGKNILDILEEQAKTRFIESYILKRFCMKLYKSNNYNEPTENDINTMKSLIDYLKQKKLKQSYWEILIDNDYYSKFLDSLDYILNCWLKKKEIKMNSNKLIYFDLETLEKVSGILIEYDAYSSANLSSTINKFCIDYEKNRILKIK